VFPSSSRFVESESSQGDIYRTTMKQDLETKHLITTTATRRNRKSFLDKMLPIVAFGGFILFSTALFGGVVGSRSNQPCTAPCIPGTEDIMTQKEHGTSHTPVQENLRWKCDGDTADRICNFNRVSSLLHLCPVLQHHNY
jgi:hypothetical protein